ncbi:hypothetical protein HQN90_20085 [Paenibacillus alba]|nr:hypothetical protein [Paenibacillus alba]
MNEIQNVIKKHAQKPFIVGYRISPEESSKDGGLRMSDTYEIIERLVQLDVDYIHASLDNLTSKPIDNEGDKSRLELILDKINDRVPLMAAGSVKTPDDALKAVELGLPLIAIGQALLIDSEWVEKTENGQEAEIDTEMKTSKLDQLELPKKLLNFILAAPGWFPISKD